MEKIRILVRSQKPFPTWAFGNYIGKTAENYTKLLQISRVVQALDDGAHDAEFYVAGASSEIYPENEFERPEEFVVLAEKGREAESFWHFIRRLQRPIIFRRSISDIGSPNSSGRPIYSFDDADQLRISQASVLSPFTLSLEGGGEIIRQLFHHKDDERRRQEKHEAELEDLATELQAKKIEAARKLFALIEQVEQSKISSPFKDTIISVISGVVEKQATLNLRATIEVESGEQDEAPRLGHDGIRKR